MDDYEDYDGVGLAKRVARGDVSPTELLDAAIARVEARDERFGAIVYRMFDVARAEIEAGLPEGPFRGVPFLLKDLHLGWPGVPLTNGSRLFADHVSKVESELVARYRRAGLVVFGRTHSPEFGLVTSSESALYGRTKNPWNLEHTSGGSSGGASTAVTAGYAPLANASDGGGSIRIPASCCGLFGMKPSRGRTPAGPVRGEGWCGMTAVHAVTRSVRDSAALLDATSAPDPGAPYQAQPPARPFLEEVGAPPGRLRISLQRATWNGTEVDPDCLTALEDAASLCRELGHEVVDEAFEVDARALGLATSTIIAVDTHAALTQRAEALGRPLAEEDVEPGTWAMASLGASRRGADLLAATRTIHAAGRQLADHLTRFDLVLSPTMAVPPVRLGVLSPSNPDRAEQLGTLLRSVGFTQLGNATGSPAMSVPLFWSESGLPIGAQFMGRRDDEATLFRLAAQLEAARPWFDRRPALDEREG